MASAVTTDKLFSRMSLRSYDHDPGSTSAVVVSSDGGTTKNYLDMTGYSDFAVICMTSVSTSSSGPTLVEILAADDTAGTNATVVVTSGTVASTHVGDNVCVQCTAAQMKEVLATARYATARITCSNAGDECVVMMGRFNPRAPQSGLTSNLIA